MQPTIVLVHGAFAESSSWDGVIAPLLAAEHRVIACAVPLRGLQEDAAYLSGLVSSVEGPVVLVGHSYGGAVVTNVDPSAGDIVGAAYIAGFALAGGETCAEASALAPGSTLADTLHTVPLADGRTDAYITQEKYQHQFAADLTSERAQLMAVTQRPITVEALNTPSTATPLWGTVPSWFLYGELDRNIPAGAHRVMAQRAGARGDIEIPGASHVVGISHPEETVQTILAAAAATVPS